MSASPKTGGSTSSGASPRTWADARGLSDDERRSPRYLRKAAGDGTPLLTTLTFDAVKSADQVAQEAKQGEDDKPKDNASVGGLLGGLARRAAQKRSAGQDENKTRATFMSSTTEILKISTDVATSDVAVPAGFKESK